MQHSLLFFWLTRCSMLWIRSDIWVTSLGTTSVTMMMFRDNTVNYMHKLTCCHENFMCTDDVKIALFKAYCTPLYTAHFWCRYSKSKYNKLRVAYNDALRILLRLPRCTSASQLFVNSGVPTLNALLRNLMYSFMMRKK